MYVGLTRAEDRLFLTYAFRRARYGESEPSVPSRFLEDIPLQLVSGSFSRRGTRQEAVHQRATAWQPEPQVAPPVAAHFRAGQRVRHATFGEGLVVESRVDGADEIVTVVFERVGLKRLMASYASLELLAG